VSRSSAGPLCEGPSPDDYQNSAEQQDSAECGDKHSSTVDPLFAGSKVSEKSYSLLQTELTNLKVEHAELRRQYLQEKHKAKSGNPFGAIEFGGGSQNVSSLNAEVARLKEENRRLKEDSGLGGIGGIGGMGSGGGIGGLGGHGSQEDVAGPLQVEIKRLRQDLDKVTAKIWSRDVPVVESASANSCPLQPNTNENAHVDPPKAAEASKRRSTTPQR